MMNYKIFLVMPFFFLYSCTLSTHLGSEQQKEVKPTITEQNVGALPPEKIQQGEERFKSLMEQPDFYYIMTKEQKNKKLTKEELDEIKVKTEQVFNKLKSITTLVDRHTMIKSYCSQYQDRSWYYLFQQSMVENTLKTPTNKGYIEKNISDSQTQDILVYFTDMLIESKLPDTKLLAWCLDLAKNSQKKTYIRQVAKEGVKMGEAYLEEPEWETKLKGDTGKSLFHQRIKKDCQEGIAKLKELTNL
jgi:hypothetical protein